MAQSNYPQMGGGMPFMYPSQSMYVYPMQMPMHQMMYCQQYIPMNNPQMNMYMNNQNINDLNPMNPIYPKPPKNQMNSNENTHF
jgi:hypothetical protein